MTTPERDENVPDIDLKELLEESGFELRRDPPPRRVLQELREAVNTEQDDPRAGVRRWLGAERRARAEGRRAARAAEAATKTTALLEGLLDAKPLLARLEGFTREPTPLAFCRVGGGLRALPLHPEVDPAELEALEPWHYVRVHPEALVILGVAREATLEHLAQGDVVEFRRYDERDPARVFVSRNEHEETVVSLAPALRDTPIHAPAKLILQRDAEHWAIGVLGAEQQTSRFEVPIDTIRTRLEDLAGMEDVIQPLVDDVLACVVRPEIRGAFDLDPLRGVLMYSYRPGAGKTSLACAFGAWLRDLGERLEFDVALYQVKPNELKSVWHGGDARLVREELCGALRARQARPRTRDLIQIVLLDELDAIGVRTSGEGQAHSPAHNDAVQALLAEMDGMASHMDAGDGPPAHVLWIGLSNLPDGIDGALKRPGRFGDLLIEMPQMTPEVGEEVLAIYLARHAELPWLVDGAERSGLERDEVVRRFLRPALARVAPEVVLRYTTEANHRVEVRAGELLAGVHYMQAAKLTKKRAALRRLYELGPGAVGLDDLVASLFEEAASVAAQMEADKGMLRRELRVEGALRSVRAVPHAELSADAFLVEECQLVEVR